MFRIIKRTMLGVLLVGGFLLVAPQTHSANAQDYWSNYWNWYDGSYRPYYRNYNRYYRPYYSGNRYYNRGFSYQRYPHSYYDQYRYHPHESYRIGPLRIERWH